MTIEAGSVVPVLALPEGDADGLALGDATLGEAALSRLLDAADPDRSPDPHVAAALLSVTDELRLGERYESVTFDVRSPRLRAPRFVRVDGTSRARLREYVASRPAPPTRADAVVGTLVEADFERYTARLRTPTSNAVTVTFEDAQADDIHRALREPATLRGLVSYDPATSAATRVDAEAVERGEQLILGSDADAFWRAATFDELAHEQRAGAPLGAEDLYDPDATEAERDDAVAAILEAQ